MSSPDDLLRTPAVAKILTVSIETLERWRSTGDPALPFRKLGPGKTSPVVYRRGDVQAFLDARKFTSTSAYGVKP